MNLQNRLGSGPALIAAVSLTVAAVACSVEQTREGEAPDIDVSAREGNLPEYEVRQTEAGEMPDVDVDVEGGQAPAYDIEGPDVEVGTEERTVTVPDVDVETEERTVTVPDIDVDLPDDEADEAG